MKDQELNNTRELHRLKESHQITEENLKEQLTKLETIRTTLERVIIQFISCDDKLFFFPRKSIL